MSSILDSIINDTFIKLKPLNKQIIFHNDDNNFRIDSRIRRDKSKILWTKNKLLKIKALKLTVIQIALFCKINSIIIVFI